MTVPVPHPRDPEAAEYAIGTLDGPERRAFDRAMEQDAALAASVRAWEERLVPLTEAVEVVQPDASTWRSLAARTFAPHDPSPDDNVLAFRPRGSADALRRSRALWRAAAGAASALAAGLALFIASERFSPARPQTLLAVVNRAGDLPALVVKVDLGGGTVQVRSLATETPAGHSLELWSVVAGTAPRSLGVVTGEATRLPLRPEDRDRLDGATLAVSVEPKGGSPTGKPTGPVVYSGKLIADTP